MLVVFIIPKFNEKTRFLCNYIQKRAACESRRILFYFGSLPAAKTIIISLVRLLSLS